jgi:DNA transformation protein and related proteins
MDGLGGQKPGAGSQGPFVAFVLDQLGDIDGLSARSMFGGTGLYSGDVFFGIVFSDTLYLKVNAATRTAYVRAGMKPFKPYRDRPTTMQYYEVPASVLEDGDELTKWAQQAVTVAATKPETPTKGGGRKRRRT